MIRILSITAACVAVCNAVCAAAQLVPKPVRVDAPSWGRATTEEATAVAMSVAKTFAKFGNVTTEDKIVVLPSNDPWPIALTSFNDRQERITKVVGRALTDDWAEFIYQFAHEYCHQFSRHYLTGYDTSFMWFAETLCELAAQWALAKVGDEWSAGEAPWPDLRAKGAGLKSYGPYQNSHCPKFKNPREFREWLDPRLPEAYKSSKPDGFNFNKTVALYMFPLFVKEPGLWAAVPYINNGQGRKNVEFGDYLKTWHSNTPAALRHNVARIAEHLGYPIAGAVTRRDAVPPAASRPALKGVSFGQNTWWPGDDPAPARMICEAVGRMFHTAGNAAAAEPVVVKQTDRARSYASAFTEDDGSRTVYVTAAGESWPMLVFELSREYANVVTRQWEAPAASQNRWFADALAASAGLWGVVRAGESSGANAPEWLGDGAAMKAFVTVRTDDVRKFGSTGEFGAWLGENMPELRRGTTSANNAVITVNLLPLFIRNPQYWQAAAYLNAGETDADADFQTYLQNWFDASPRNLRPAVSAIAAHMNFTVR